MRGRGGTRKDEHTGAKGQGCILVFLEPHNEWVTKPTTLGLDFSLVGIIMGSTPWFLTTDEDQVF